MRHTNLIMSTLQRNDRTSFLAIGIYLAIFTFALACYIRWI